MSNRTRFAGLAAALALAGCGSQAPPVPDAPPGGVAVNAAIVPSHDDQLIEVTADDRMPITAVTLVMPNGSKTAAESIDTVEDPSESSDRAINPMDAALPGNYSQPFSGAMTETTTVIGRIASTAHVRIAPADYAAAWRSSHLDVRFGRDAGSFTQEVPAPAPP